MSRNTVTYSPAPTANTTPAALHQHAWVAIALAAINMAFFAGVDYGNMFGIDEWGHLYRTCQMSSLEIAGRPFALLSLYALCPFFKPDLILYHVVLIILRALSAFLLYLLVWQISRKALFAFACGLVFSTFLVADSFLLISFLQQNDHILSQVLVLLSLCMFVAQLQTKTQGIARVILLAIGLLLAALTALVREATIPLLLAVPVLIVIFERDYSRPRLIVLTLWTGAVAAAIIRFVIVALNSTANYSRSLFTDINVDRILISSKDQILFAFSQLIKLNTVPAYEFRVASFIAISVAALCLLGIRRHLTGNTTHQTKRQNLVSYSTWLAVGLLAAWLGVSAFLPTIYASSTIRTHMLSLAGESVALASLIWLISHFFSNTRWRSFIQVIGLAYVALVGTTTANTSQKELYEYAATWDNSASFFRSLANLAPTVKSKTLFIYVENLETEETPLVNGAGFQYAIRYFYNDAAAGLMPSDNIVGHWSATDAGFEIDEQWQTTPHLYRWDDLIVFTRENSGQLVIVETLPEEFWTAERQGLYRPYAQIEPGFVSERIREIFPLISGPDWSYQNTLLH